MENPVINAIIVLIDHEIWLSKEMGNILKAHIIELEKKPTTTNKATVIPQSKIIDECHVLIMRYLSEEWKQMDGSLKDFYARTKENEEI